MGTFLEMTTKFGLGTAAAFPCPYYLSSHLDLRDLPSQQTPDQLSRDVLGEVVTTG